MLRERPRWWPHFTSTLRSTAVTARLGRVIGLAVAILFLTGLLCHYQYEPWAWLPQPAAPVWGFRLTQGIHVAVGIATIPLLLVKLWSVYPNLFRFPPVKSIKNALERISIALLVSSALVQVSTGFLNVLNWYPFPWYFTTVHRFLGYVRGGVRPPPRCGQVARHRVRAQGQGCRGRCAQRDHLGREPRLP